MLRGARMLNLIKNLSRYFETRSKWLGMITEILSSEKMYLSLLGRELENESSYLCR